MKARTSSRAFTLVELLVVIAILAAILFPVFTQAKMAAKKSVSLFNIKHSGSARRSMRATETISSPSTGGGGDPGETYYGEPYQNGALDPAAPTNWIRGT